MCVNQGTLECNEFKSPNNFFCCCLNLGLKIHNMLNLICRITIAQTPPLIFQDYPKLRILPNLVFTSKFINNASD